MKNKLFTRMLAIFMALFMLTALAACQSKDGSESSSEGSGESGGSSASDEEAPVTGVLPLTDEPITLTMYTGPMNESFATIARDYNESYFFRELEKRTGVHIEFETTSAGASDDAFNLMIASGSLPDLIVTPDKYQSGLDAGVEDGYFLDLTPYVETYMPNYNRLRLMDEATTRDSVTDGGRIVGVYQIMQSEQPPWLGMMMRKDWLDDLGLDVPVTAEEWETVLTAFKEEKGAFAPLAMSGMYGHFASGFNVDSGFGSGDYIVIDGKVQFCGTSDEAKAWLEVFSDWYAKGLIDPDFMTKSSDIWVDTALVVTGQTGAFFSMYTLGDMYMAASADPEMELVGVNPPIPYKGFESKVSFKMSDSMIGAMSCGISTSCENVEIALQWLDYLYSEEGSLLANYGIEGESFNYVDGKPVFSDLVVNNPDGLTMNQAMPLYALPPSMLGCYYDWERELGGISDQSLAMTHVWGTVSSDYKYPSGAAMTIDENNEYAGIFNDIQTYVNENIALFISGVKSLDEWDSFVADVEKMNVERCVDIRQSAYDRYNER